VHDEVNQDYSEQNEVDGMKKGADCYGHAENKTYLQTSLTREPLIGVLNDELWQMFRALSIIGFVHGSSPKNSVSSVTQHTCLTMNKTYICLTHDFS